MNNTPVAKEPPLCNKEAEHIVTHMNSAFEWVQLHRGTEHPKDVPLRRIVLMLDFGHEYQRLIAVAGDEPPSREYLAELMAHAWGQVHDPENAPAAN